jgi:phosphoglycolate phosphatase-like HAD superfamily hydrolase
MRAARYLRRGKMLLRPEVEARVREADTLIFDVDGVLIDVSNSIRLVNGLAAHRYLTQVVGWPDTGPLVDPAEVDEFKRAPGFNDDWDLTAGLVLLLLVRAHRARTNQASRLKQAPPSVESLTQALRRSGDGFAGLQRLLLEGLPESARQAILAQWDRATITRIFKEIFAGEKYCPVFYGFEPQYVRGPGYIERDRPLVGREDLPRHVPHLAIYSGRTWEETRAALECVGWAERIGREDAVVADDGILKPNPEGLARLVKRCRSKAAIFVGDMPDDREAARRYREARGSQDTEVFDCLVMSGPIKQMAEARQAGADIIAPDARSLIRWVDNVRAEPVEAVR